MKKSRLYSIIALAVSFTILCASFVAPAVAKLVFGKQLTFKDADGTEHDDLDYTVNSVFEVKTQDEFFAAINQGYSYVQLSKDIENPLIITESAENLERDLILDLNGIEIQRNGSDPILNVGPGVRLTVTDTSDEQTGGLYNPVGSVFNIEGGVLTVITGSFECGPRYSEYYSYNTDVLANNNNTTKRTVVQSIRNVNYYEGNSTEAVTRTAPIILSYPTRTGEIVYNHGNLYFDVAYTGADLDIPEDTYCYYRTSEDSSNVNSATDADWYYTYYVKPEDYSYVGTTVANPDDYVLITIYGYENTLERAAAVDKADEYYAAIQMIAGNLDVIKGEFFCYFGLPNTACVNAYNGTLTIKDGDFSSRIPNAVTTTGTNNVMQKEEDKDAFTYGNYFQTFEWANETNTGGAQARQGKAYGILTSSDKAKVSVGTGEFYSSNNNIINMSGGGELTIGSGTFTKQLIDSAATTFVVENAAVHTGGNSTLEVTGDFTTYGANTAGIFTEGGMVTVSSNFVLNGASSMGVYSKSGTLDVKGDFELLGDSSAGVLSEGGNVTVAGDFTFSGASSLGVYSKSGTLDVNGNFEFAGTDSYGIYAEDGTITVDGNLTLNGASSYGVYSKSGTLTVAGDVTLAGEYSYGVFSEGGTITMSNSEITAASNLSCYGVYVNTTSESSLTLTDATISVGYNVSNSKSGTHLASAGIFLASSSNSTAINLSGTTTINSNELGIAIRGGTLNVTGTGTINTEYASAIAVLGGRVNFDSASSYTIVSKNTRTAATTNSYNMYLDRVGSPNNGFTENYPNTDGVYVSGGDFTARGTLNLTHTGLYNDVSGYTNFSNLTITSYAVRVAGGSVTISPDSDNKHTVLITNSSGGGVYCSSGSLTLGNPDYQVAAGGNINDVVKVTTTGTAWSGTVHGNGTWGGQGWDSPKIQSGGPAIDLNGGSITVHNGTYKAALGDGVLAKIPYDASMTTPTASITINNGYFDGQMDNYSASRYSGPAGCYGLKVIGGAEVNINGGLFLGKAGSASVTGISSFTSADSYTGNWAHVYVKAGTFGNADNPPNDGFMIFDKAKVALGSATADESSLSRSDAITIHSKLCSISVNQLSLNGSQTPHTSYVYVYYGSYNGGQSDVYNEGNFSYIKVYNVIPKNGTAGSNVIRVTFTDNGMDGVNGYNTNGTNYNNIGTGGYPCVYYYNTVAQYFKESDFTDPKNYNGN